MMSKEATARSAISAERAMKLALDALKRMKRYGNTFGYRSNEQNPYEQVCEAIEALEALASEAKEQPAPATELREQESVQNNPLDCNVYLGSGKDHVIKHHVSYGPAQRTWVGLTDEEKSDIWCVVTNRDFVTEDTHVYADAIEAKLKEKNT